MSSESNEQSAKDLVPAPFPDLDWTANDTAAELEKLIAYSTAAGQSAVSWYYVKRRPKQLGGMALRVGAIVAGAAAGVIPILGEIFEVDGKPGIPPGWAAVAIALAALLVLLDRFWGFTSAWVRFLVAGQDLGERLEVFRLDVAAQRLSWTGGQPDESETAAMVLLCREFLLYVHTAVRAETGEWAVEFQGVLRQIETSTKAVKKARALGGLTVTVTNGDRCEDGWTLAIDGGGPVSHSGKTAALRNLNPTIHTLVALGTIDGEDRRAEASVEVAGGRISPVSLTLD